LHILNNNVMPGVWGWTRPPTKQYVNAGGMGAGTAPTRQEYQGIDERIHGRLYC